MCLQYRFRRPRDKNRNERFRGAEARESLSLAFFAIPIEIFRDRADTPGRANRAVPRDLRSVESSVSKTRVARIVMRTALSHIRRRPDVLISFLFRPEIKMRRATGECDRRVECQMSSILIEPRTEPATIERRCCRSQCNRVSYK